MICPIKKPPPASTDKPAAPASTLSGGQQQIVKRLIGVVGTLAAQGVGVLLIEQFAHLALQVAHHAYVLSRGELRYDGPPQTLESDPSLLHAAYLGGGA